ncbi:hypothetical protein LTV02_24410 [Nocardia yamanashiensis]|uniref:hypothetical protein n=1 Tax=Nocardia yamanashiensis TaxID=209247 RepID=UPI001E296BC5|nr:hypothetical protein [Nocardia yamanashiensis]UGT39218.1 hypothetical protein LTV02_24410 [Nocardia yamanashiensis]
MTDRSIESVPEADYVEQHTPAYPGDEPYPDADAYPDQDVLADSVIESDSETAPVPAGDSGWTANEADLVEQSIPVPLDDEYDAANGE